MKRTSLFFWLLLPPAFLLFLFSLSVFLLLVQFIPPEVGWAVVGVGSVVTAWFLVVRRRGSVLSGSEYSLTGRQSSKEGLL